MSCEIRNDLIHPFTGAAQTTFPSVMPSLGHGELTMDEGKQYNYIFCIMTLQYFGNIRGN